MSAIGTKWHKAKALLDPPTNAPVADVLEGAVGVAAPLVVAAVSSPGQVAGQVAAPASAWRDKLATTAKQAPAADADSPLDQAAAGRSAVQPAASPMPAPVEVVLHIDGQALVEAKPASVSVRSAVNEIPAASVELVLPTTEPDDYAALNKVLNVCAVGKPVVLTLDRREAFVGRIGEVQVQLRPGGLMVRLKLKHALHGLKDTRRSQVFEDQSDLAVLQNRLKAHGIAVNANPTHSLQAEQEQRVQWDCSDWTFVRALAGMHGAWLWAHGRQVRLGPPVLTGAGHELSIKPGKRGPVIAHGTWTISGLSVPAGIDALAWDVQEQAISHKSAKASVFGKNALDPVLAKSLVHDAKAARWTLPHPGTIDGPGLQALADGALFAQRAQAVRAQLTLEGCQPYQPGDTLLLSDLAGHGVQSSGIITAVEYELTAEPRKAQTIVMVGLAETAALAPALPVPDGLLMGKVAAFRADPKHGHHRWRVKLPLLGEHAELWARLASPYASADSGLCFYPEPGDEVVLGFVGSDPLILGATHNPKQKAPLQPSAENARKAVIFEHGKAAAQMLAFEHKGADKKALWQVGKEQTLTMDQAKGVFLVSDKGEVKLSGAHHVNLLGAQSLTLGSKSSELALKPDTARLRSTDLKVSGEETATFFGGSRGKLVLSAGSAALSGLDVQVKGAQVAVNADVAIEIVAPSIDLKM